MAASLALPCGNCDRDAKRARGHARKRRAEELRVTLTTIVSDDGERRIDAFDLAEALMAKVAAKPSASERIISLKHGAGSLAFGRYQSQHDRLGVPHSVRKAGSLARTSGLRVDNALS